ncbi:hypothetical protein ACFQ3R_01585 [Mesonia ostreae]|uniref:Lipoprotein n=1 Tax=Mesonia ostreae TaxID=861110 RepID=A0ABU2KI35_9FLAO|nr:hypothetical protein [Mesonia ostreae]MDT0294375.1 hypothetical protein [Mesonia ostreae]
MRRFLLISTCFLLVSCGLPLLKNLEETGLINAPKSIENPYFKELDSYLFKSSISIYNHDLSGILVIKKLSDTSSRVAFTTEFGNTLLDMTITQNSYEKHFAINKLDKKIILRTLAKDIRTLTANHLKTQKAFRQGEKEVLMANLNKFQVYFFFSDNQLEEIVKTTKNSEKLKIQFSQDEVGQLNLINLAHEDIDLHIQLRPID